MGDAMGIKAPVEEEDDKKTSQAMQLGSEQEAKDEGAGGAGVDYKQSSKYAHVP